jgi:asparagine synthase (glutamine-hydrolysing)
MASSLESRVPLLDHRLVDLVTSMPPRLKFKGGELKFILKRAVKDLVPKSIFQRKDKMGFPVPMHLWARGRSRQFFSDILLSRSCRERGIFDAEEVRKLMDYETAFSRRLWGLLNLELWFRTFIDESEQAHRAVGADRVMERQVDTATGRLSNGDNAAPQSIRVSPELDT